MARGHLNSPSAFKDLFTTKPFDLVSCSVLRLHLIISHLLGLVNFIYWLRISVWFLVFHNIYFLIVITNFRLLLLGVIILPQQIHSFDQSLKYTWLDLS